jgi:hypothetical protein
MPHFIIQQRALVLQYQQPIAALIELRRVSLIHEVAPQELKSRGRRGAAVTSLAASILVHKVYVICFCNTTPRTAQDFFVG